MGSALDRSGFDGVIGTVAGDDTVLVVAAQDVGGDVMAGRLADLAGTNGAGTNDTVSNDTILERHGYEWHRDERSTVMAKRVVLAHSGGLDTSVAVRWLQEELGVEVIAVAVDVGQGGDFGLVRQRALAAGAVESVVIDARSEMAEDFVVPAIAANARYEGKYPLVSSLSRPVIVRHLVAEARRHGADGVAHGCTAKGNDQVRFEVGTRTLAPDLEILAPARMWGMTREDCVEYAQRYGIPIEATKEKLYSIDENLWGRAIECGAIEDPWAAPPPDVFTLTRPTATEPRDLVLGFEAGVPVTVDGRALALRRAHRRGGGRRGRLRLGPDRHGREPPGGHQEPRDLRVPRRPGDPARALATSRTSPSSATWPTRRPDSSRAGPSSCTTGCGSRRSKRRSTPSSPARSVTSPARCAWRCRPAAAS